MGGVILGFNRQRQRLNGAHVQIGHLGNVTLFAVQLRDVQADGTVNQVNQRQRQ